MARMGLGKGRSPATRRVTKASGRYTPPTPRTSRVSPRWVPAFMLTTLICGAVIIMTGYFGLQRGGTQILFLLVGAVFVTAGVVAATRYR